ncbi:MAG TPA: C40 family peptidase [Pyrinomonadaceae bacterium]|nr:C40 family peptidase [Pyrinomonadaceae bacterium]
MSFRLTFPRACLALSALCLLAASVSAQTDSRPRYATTVAPTAGAPRLENDPVVIFEAEESEESDEAETAAPLKSATQFRLKGFDGALFVAIDERMGVPYRLGATGPNRYDCSGFVWSVYQAAGVEFERGSARTLWQRFEPAEGEDRFKFGTLVFFNHLGHVGIVADREGFYHASTSRGVVYSKFNDYWTKRLVGFRRVPLATLAKVSVK